MKHLVVVFVWQQLVRQLEHAAAGAGPGSLLQGRHPDGAVAESECGGELEHGGVEDGAGVDGVADVVRDGADDAPDGLLAAADGGEVAVELARLGAEEGLADLEAEQAREEDREGDGGGGGGDGAEDLGGGERDEDGAVAVAVVGEGAEQVRDAAHDDEGAQLEEHPPERRQGGAGGEVEQLQRDGQEGGRDEQVAHLLPLQHRLHRGFLAPVAPAAPPRQRRHVCLGLLHAGQDAAQRTFHPCRGCVTYVVAVRFCFASDLSGGAAIRPRP